MEQASIPKYKLFAVGAIGTFMATLDGSILNVSLPTIARDLNCDVGLVAWVILAYSLTMVSLLIPFGAWTARRGYRFAYKFGYLFFITGSLLCATADSIYWLIVARIVQAVGTAMFASVGPGMVTTVFGPEERGKGIGLMVMMVSAGFMTGPPLGGFILSLADWHWIFLINIPIGLVGLGMTLRYFGILKQQKQARPFNFASAVCSAVGLVSGIFALSLIDEYRLSDPRLWGPGLISVSFLSGFIWLELKSKSKLIGLDIFRNKVFSTSLGAQLAHFAGLSGVLVLIPFYLEQVKGFEPKEVGLYLVILPIMMFLVAPLSGRYSDKIGYRVLTGAGMVIMAAGLVMMLGLTSETSGSYLIGCLVVIGFGVGLFTTPNSSAMMGSVTEPQRPVASGILATNRNIGMGVGVALSTAMFAHYQTAYADLGSYSETFTASLTPAVYVALGWCALGLLFSMMRANR